MVEDVKCGYIENKEFEFGFQKRAFIPRSVSLYKGDSDKYRAHVDKVREGLGLAPLVYADNGEVADGVGKEAEQVRINKDGVPGRTRAPVKTGGKGL